MSGHDHMDPLQMRNKTKQGCLVRQTHSPLLQLRRCNVVNLIEPFLNFSQPLGQQAAVQPVGHDCGVNRADLSSSIRTVNRFKTALPASLI